MRKKFSQRLQWQYFASYLALMLIFMVAFYMFSLNSFHHFHARNVEDNYLNRLGLIRDKQEDVLGDMVAIAGQIMDMSSIVPFDYMQEPDKAILLMNQMAAYRSRHDALEGLCLHFYDDDFVYSSTGLYTLERFAQSALRMDRCSPQTLTDLLELTSRQRLAQQLPRGPARVSGGGKCVRAALHSRQCTDDPL